MLTLDNDAALLDLAMKVALIVHDEAGYGDIYVP
jgi:hypothetical protein